MVDKVIKRNGEEVKFDSEKITRAIYKSMIVKGSGDLSKAKEYTKLVLGKLEGFSQITVEKIQDKVIEVLNVEDEILANIYSSYREERRLARFVSDRLKIKGDLKLSKNSLEILENRYLQRDSKGNVIETPRQLFERVGKAIAVVELCYDYLNNKKKSGNGFLYFGEFNISKAEKALSDIKKEFKTTEKNPISFSEYARKYAGNAIKYSEKFIEMMSNLNFLPNTPTLMNAGTELGGLSACFVLPVEDSLDKIFDSVKDTALVHRFGGGTGFNFTNLRPQNDFVKSTQGVASGPVSFMKVFDAVTEEIKQGGKRRGANMGILRYDHPDIMQFISIKDSNNTKLKNFNVSVAVDEEFFEALRNDSYIKLHSPRYIEPVNRLRARDLFDAIVTNAWQTGDPGLVFLDRINKDNYLVGYGDMEATNPCAEQSLHDYESCNLGSINLSKFVDANKNFKFDEFREIIRLAVRFLDNVVDINVFPTSRFSEMNRISRKIGLGIMGFADMLVLMGIKYDSLEALNMAESVMKFLQTESYKMSEELAIEKYPFPNSTEKFNGPIRGNRYKSNSIKTLRRNSTVQSIAPTGTISIIADCSSGIEPYFALAYKRSYNSMGVKSGTYILIEKNKYLERDLIKEGLYSETLIDKIAETGRIGDLEEIPQHIRDLYVTSHEISPEMHILMQSVFQNYCDSGVSKTINLPHSATIEDVKKAYLMARELNCKGITVFRDGSKNVQVLQTLKEEKKENSNINLVPTVVIDPNTTCSHGTCDL